jgi:hypothetical protein
MTRRTNVLLALATVAAVALSVAIPALSSSSAAKTRIGTFKRTEILVAWVRSATYVAPLRDLIRQQNEAKAKGDTQLVQSFEERGEAMQERAHRQLAGEETMPEILAALAPAMADVAKETGVAAIAETLLHYEADSIEVVDVTAALAKRLTPAEKPVK